jgi:hypothetical protein
MTVPRRRLMGASMVSVVLGAVLALVAAFSTPLPVRAQNGAVTTDMLFDWMTKYSNWGRWGTNDSLGSMNTVTTRMRLRAADLVKLGLPVTMARRPYNQPFDPQRPRDPAFPNIAPMPIPPQDVDDTNPFFLWMNPPNFTSDRWNLALAGAVHSHLDSLCHIASPATASPRVYPVRMVYNGRPLTENNTATGCRANGIEHPAVHGIFTRGILLDATLLPRLREGNNPWLAPGTGVTRADLEEIERIEGVMVGPGDVVLLYTGRWKRRAALGPWPGNCNAGGSPPTCGWAGWWYDVIPYFYDHDVAQFGNDAINETIPDGMNAYATQPYHGFQSATGWAHYDNLDLEALASVAKQLRRYEFLFTTAPYPVVGGVTSPLNPMAVF